MQPLPSLNVVFAMVLQEERHQRVTSITKTRSDVVGFFVQTPHNNSVSYGRGRMVTTCNYCGRTGDIMRDCYQLHGFPETRNDTSFGLGRGWNNTSGRGMNQNNGAFNVGGSSGQQHTISPEDGAGLTLSKEQMPLLVQLLNLSSAPPTDRMFVLLLILVHLIILLGTCVAVFTERKTMCCGIH
ncbi:hypothetical protein V5N11_011475 [Cardamine amara subsp. amara]|uniref:CCHC-type domain-containing protein n=1 Tax=Cardamine amara subsp. amara TaxID=228776 RepID=A0ABD1BFD0_CARAN